MKELKCPSCGAIVIKNVDDDKYVCSHCGTLFINKEIQQNQIINNITSIKTESVNITGENVKNLLSIANDYLNTDKYRDALIYYDKILTIDDHNTDAIIGKIIVLFHTETLETGEVKAPCYYVAKLFEYNNKNLETTLKKINEILLVHFNHTNLEYLKIFNDNKNSDNAATYLYCMYSQILIIDNILDIIKSYPSFNIINEYFIKLLKFNCELCYKCYGSLYHTGYNVQGESMHYCTGINSSHKNNVNLLFDKYKSLLTELGYSDFVNKIILEDNGKNEYIEITTKEKKQGRLIFITAFVIFTIIFTIIFLALLK